MAIGRDEPGGAGVQSIGAVVHAASNASMPSPSGPFCLLCRTTGHGAEECEQHDTGVVALIDNGAAKAGSQEKLAAIIGITEQNLSRYKRLGRLASDHREQIVHFLRGEVVVPVKRGRGRRAKEVLDFPTVTVQGEDALVRIFAVFADEHPRGHVGAASDALRQFLERHEGENLGKIEPPTGKAKLRCRVDADVLARFDAFVGARYRTRWVRVAVSEWIEKQQQRWKKPG